MDARLLYLDVGDPGKPAEHLVVEENQPKMEPYFPKKTLTFTRGEQEFLLLQLSPSKTELCHVRLELTVIDRDKQMRLLIPATGDGFPLMPAGELNAAYPKVYLGSGVCKKVVPASTGYLAFLQKSDFEGACGRGNALN